jgi:hypothetical protein
MGISATRSVKWAAVAFVGDASRKTRSVDEKKDTPNQNFRDDDMFKSIIGFAERCHRPTDRQWARNNDIAQSSFTSPWLTTLISPFPCLETDTISFLPLPRRSSYTLRIMGNSHWRNEWYK